MLIKKKKKNLPFSWIFIKSIFHISEKQKNIRYIYLTITFTLSSVVLCLNLATSLQAVYFHLKKRRHLLLLICLLTVAGSLTYPNVSFGRVAVRDERRCG